jgi:alpha-1,6-mannosyltransferase
MNTNEARLAGAALTGLAGYAGLAVATRFGAGAEVWALLAAHGLGWVALAWAWREWPEAGGRGAMAVLIAAAVLFRAGGLMVSPGWEDDVFRYLWDGWMTWETGSPYGVAPLEWFAAPGVPERMQAVLDGVNHPEHATLYGPVAQAWFAAAARVAAGEAWVLKAGLVAAEGAACWAIWRAGGGRALLFAAWCPVAVTEIAFAGHVDAVALAGVALALGASARGWAAGACGWLAVAVATKAYAVLLAPFFLWRAGWRGAAVFAAVLSAAYLPWMAAMAGGFEFNSTGHALLARALGPESGRIAAGVALAGGLAGVFFWWIRRGGAAAGAGAAAIPGAAAVGWWALWSPVFHPWYGLLALPFVAARPAGWSVGLLGAPVLSYLHGLTLPAGLGGTGDFRHPWWVRPAEAWIVALGAARDFFKSRPRRRGTRRSFWGCFRL